MSDGTKPSELEGALTGLIKINLYRAEQMNKEPDELMIMYPTNFLRNDKWKEYIRYKGIHRGPRL